jgi:hypothetical protein
VGVLVASGEQPVIACIGYLHVHGLLCCQYSLKSVSWMEPHDYLVKVRQNSLSVCFPGILWC